MKKHVMLGVKDEYGLCCILRCLLPFDQLSAEDVQSDDFVHDSTNWNGCDRIERTLGILQTEPTGRRIMLNPPVIFCGVDHDMGHEYSWGFTVDEIWELKEDIRETND